MVRSTVMNLVDGKTGLFLRLAALSAALMFGQQALAAGTEAGTDITNEVTVGYQVGGVDQTPLVDSVTFKVDRRVDFTLTPISTPDLEPVTPGENDAWVDFTLTNTSNSDLDFLLAAANTDLGDPVDGSGNDNAQMSGIEWAVVTATDLVPLQGGAQIVDELAADASVRIRVWADADAGMTIDEIAGIDLTATARLAGAAGLGGVLAYGVADDPANVENVDPNGAAGVRVAVDGFIVQDAQITVSKSNTIVGGGPAIPGATIEYTITIENSGTAPATNVAITDTLMSELTLVPNGASGSDFYIVNNGTGAGCTAAPGDDDCVLSGADITIDNLTIAAAAAPPTPTTLTVTFRATIRATGPTIP
jgi:uncharacterized repeat protein (TIGR01451 family)